MGFRLSHDELWTMVAEAHTGVVTTLRRDGRPITLPIWHVVLDEAVYLRTPRRSKKVQRIAHDARGTFLVESGEQWAELRAVMLPVTASLVDDADEAARAGAAIDEKYADFVLRPDDLPAGAAAAYGDMVVIRLDPDGDPVTWDNAALVGKA